MNFHSGLGTGLSPLASIRPYRWYYVRPRFEWLGWGGRGRLASALDGGLSTASQQGLDVAEAHRVGHDACEDGAFVIRDEGAIQRRMKHDHRIGPRKSRQGW